MVDNRSTGFVGMSGLNFKQGDSSGMANAMTDEKMGQGGEYFAQEEEYQEENQKNQEFVDRSAQLKGSLDSLAMLNATNVLRVKKNDSEKKEKKTVKKSKKTLGHLVDDYEKS